MTFNRLPRDAQNDIRSFLLQVQTNPYSPDIASKYQKNFEQEGFRRYSSHGYALEWHVEVPRNAALPMRILITGLDITGTRLL